MNKKKLQNDVKKDSLVSPLFAGIISALIPGLGQMLARSFRRGLVLFASFFSLVGLIAWRIRVTARRDTEFFAIILKAFHLQPVLIILVVLIFIIYIWIIIDAVQLAKKTVIKPISLLLMVLIVFFLLGWQIGEINLYSFISQADEAGPALMRVLWPWQRAISYPEEYQYGSAAILSPCTDEAFPATEPLEDEPYIISSPTCGIPTDEDGTPGTELTLHGYNFFPNSEAEIWWEDPIGNEFRQRKEGDYLKVVTDENGEFTTTVIFPYRLIPLGAQAQETQEWKVKAKQLSAVGEWEFSTELKLAIEKIIETIFIGMMATFFGIILALPISFLAARNLMSENGFTVAIYYLVRTILNIIRSIEPLIWAIIAVIVVGLGPFAGICALTLHSMAALAKLYSESIESIDSGPIEAIHATGANWVQTVMFAVIPQIIPPFVSFTIYRWDINIRMSTIIGFVGGGGIGFLLAQWIRLLDYSAAGIAVWFIAITVAILDYVSAEIRSKFV